MGDERLDGPPRERGAVPPDKKKKRRDLFQATVNDLRKGGAKVTITFVSGEKRTELKIVSFDRESLIAIGAGDGVGRRFFILRSAISMIDYEDLNKPRE